MHGARQVPPPALAKPVAASNSLTTKQMNTGSSGLPSTKTVTTEPNGNGNHKVGSNEKLGQAKWKLSKGRMQKNIWHRLSKMTQIHLFPHPHSFLLRNMLDAGDWRSRWNGEKMIFPFLSIFGSYKLKASNRIKDRSKKPKVLGRVQDHLA